MARSKKTVSDPMVLELLDRAQRRRAMADSARALELVREASDRLYASGQKREAVDLLARERDFTAAAQLAERMKDWKRAAQLWFRAGDFMRAAQAWIANDEPHLAAELYEKAGDLASAAAIYEQYEDFIRASGLCERAGQKRRAADLLVRALSAPPHRRVIGHAADEACRRAGILYAEVGDLAPAVQVLRWGGQIGFAGRLLARAGRIDEAADLLAESGDLLGAAELARSIGNEHKAQLLLAMRDEKEGRFREAAARFEEAEMYLEASRLYEYAGDHAAAAEAFERAGHFDSAREVYEHLGRFDDAARCLRALGRDAEALALADASEDTLRACLAAGDLLGAAGVLIVRARRGEQGSYHDAALVLEQIGPDHPDYLRARASLAEVLSEQGEAPAALAILEALLSGVAVGPNHLPALYQYGRMLELEGYLAQARETYRIALAIDPGFRDISSRLQFLHETDSRSIPPMVPVAPLVVPTPIDALRGAPPGFDPIAATADLIEDASPRPPSLFGVVLRGRFRIEKRIGKGAQAEVYLARDLVLDRPVAIKVLNEAVAEDEQALQRFLREARLAARVHHASCIAIFDFGQEAGVTFMAMEYFEGKTLRELLKDGPLPSDRALVIAIEIAEALSAIHRAGIVHRDVKPTNVILDEYGTARLTDFGVAKSATEETAASSSGLMVGTMKYMSPEQARGKQADGRSDIFSLGVVLFEMLAGKAPFGGTLDALIKRVTEPPPLLPPEAEVSERIRRIVYRCMQRNPDARYSTVDALASDLRAAFAEIR